MNQTSKTSIASLIIRGEEAESIPDSASQKRLHLSRLHPSDWKKKQNTQEGIKKAIIDFLKTVD